MAKARRAIGWKALGSANALLAMICTLALVRVVSTLWLRIPFDFNEGWNAFHAAAVYSVDPLYPPKGAWFPNNYPPLSFYLVGAMGLLIHDNILAGRIVSLLAFLVVGAGIVAVARALGARREMGLFGALFFTTILAFDTTYAGVNDPQMLGHAFGIGGLWLALSGPRTAGRLAASALLLSLAFFTKHNLIAQPIALLLWLAVVERRAAIILAAWGAAFSGIGLAGFQFHYGRSLLSVLDSPRVFQWERSFRALAGYLEICGLPIAAFLAAANSVARNRAILFCVLYLLVSLALGTLFEGGDDIESNVLFDNLIALGLCAAVGFDFLLQRSGKEWLAGAYVTCFVLPLLAMLALRAAEDNFYPRYWLDRQNEVVRAAASDIELIRAQPEPVLCSDLAFCYWAGKQAQLDVGAMRQAILTHNRGSGELAAAIAGRRYALLALDLSYPGLWPAPVQSAVWENYRLIRSDEFGSFWVRR